MRNRKRLLIGAGVTVALIAAGAFAGWYFVLRSDAPPPVDLASAVAAATATTGTSTTGTPTTGAPDVGSAAATTTTAAANPAPAGDGVSGAWTIGPGTDSFVGYRVKEELATVGFTEAVGRTSEIVASMTIDGATVTAVAVEADMTTLRSDSSNRDRALRDQSIETARFPTATFELTEPIELGTEPVDGASISATATGALTIHGVTQPVTVPIDAQLAGDTIVIVASIPVAFADYDIDPPSSFRLLSVEDNGVIEMQLLFTQT